ncbi:MAG: hypothetical protein AAB354_03040 [candidate division KSB1 bacterium]
MWEHEPDAFALYWNPAGLAQMTSNELIFSHVSWPVDVRHEFVGYVHRFGGANALGLSVTALHTDDLEETTEFQPLGTGNYVPFGDLAVGLSFTRQMTDRFSFGVTLKYMDETLAEATGAELNGKQLSPTCLPTPRTPRTLRWPMRIRCRRMLIRFNSRR